MLAKEVTIINKLGLHARAAAKFVGVASRFSADISLEKNGRAVNGKSIMGVMMLAAGQGSVLELSAEGEDEQSAVEALEALIDNRFDEPE
ncbi:MAG: HPr family phosphocarrier protein [Gammaproteobacteria bacterium]